jgi:ACR3 family arsenite transporter
MIGASNHFEVAIATSVTAGWPSSGAALATVVGVLIEVPLMLCLSQSAKKHPLYLKNVIWDYTM